MKKIRPRPLVASMVVSRTPRAFGGGRDRSELVELAGESIAKGSKSFAAASLLFDRVTRERAHLLYAWCRRCDDIADGQDHGGTLNLEGVTAFGAMMRAELEPLGFDVRWIAMRETGRAGHIVATHRGQQRVDDP